jgi:RimJ/RimL family protein N-acetyltransferase
VGPDGYLYLTCAQLNRLLKWNNGQDNVQYPFRLYKNEAAVAVRPLGIPPNYLLSLIHFPSAMPEFSPPYHQVPVLGTERLRLRALQLSDFDDYFAMSQDPAVYRFLTGSAPDEEAVWTVVLRLTGHWALQGFGYWAVEEKAGGRFCGVVGFADGKRTIEPAIKGFPEVGWVLAPHAHGKGYATEAVTAAMTWADAHFGAVRMVCIMDTEHAVSRRVAEKFGFREFARTTYHGEPTLMLERLPAV